MRVRSGRLLLLLGVAVVSAAFAEDALPPRRPMSHSPSIDIEKSGFREPSDIVYHAKRRTLFLVGDEGDVAEIRTDGTVVKSKRVRKGDFEGVTYDPATSLVYVGVEGEEKILELDPDSFEVLREFSIPRTFKGATVMKAGGDGIEAIAFVPDAKHPQGGTFFVANQSFDPKDKEDGSAIFELSVPLKGTEKRATAEIVRMIPMPILDIAALCRDPKTGGLLVASDKADTLLEMTLSGKIERSWTLPGRNQEGVALDDEDHLYVAQDSGGVLRFHWDRMR